MLEASGLKAVVNGLVLMGTLMARARALELCRGWSQSWMGFFHMGFHWQVKSQAAE